MRIPDRKIASPETNPETAAYWEAAKAGTLLIRRCRACGKAHHYPRTICPFCFSSDTDWQKASGRGIVYSYSVMRQAAQPYVVAYVALDEGPKMMTNIVDADIDEIAIGTPVTMVVKPTENGQEIPMFTPVRAGKGA